MGSPVVIRCLTTDVPRRSRSWLHRHRTRLGVVALLGAIGVGVLMPVDARAQTTEPDPTTVRALLLDRAAAHGLSWSSTLELLATVRCESRFRPSARGAAGEVGLAQWLPPSGGGNAWDSTTAYRRAGIRIEREYARGNPDAAYYDADGAAEMFSAGRATRRQHWTCWRRLFGGGW